MHLINDIYLITPLCRRILYLINDLADIVYSVVGGGIDFDHIHRGSLCNPPAHRAFSTGASLCWIFTVDRPCQNLCYGGFSGSSCPTKQIGMTDPICLNLIF